MYICKLGAAAKLRQRNLREIWTREKRASHQPLTRFTTQQTSKQTEERMMCHIAFIVSFFAHHCFHRKKKYRKEKKVSLPFFFSILRKSHRQIFGDLFFLWQRHSFYEGWSEERDLYPPGIIWETRVGGRFFLDGGRGRRRWHHNLRLLRSPTTSAGVTFTTFCCCRRSEFDSRSGIVFSPGRLFGHFAVSLTIYFFCKKWEKTTCNGRAKSQKDYG